MFAIDIAQLEHFAPVQGVVGPGQLHVLIAQLHDLHPGVELDWRLVHALRQKQRPGLLEGLGRIRQAARGVRGPVRFLVVVHEDHAHGVVLEREEAKVKKKVSRKDRRGDMAQFICAILFISFRDRKTEVCTENGNKYLG